MSSNKEILDYLFQTDQINLKRGPIFDLVPIVLPERFDFDRIEGMMFGLAIGNEVKE